MADRKLKFEVSGECDDIDWDPAEWTDSESKVEFEGQLNDIAEDRSTWGPRLVGDTIDKLWAEVQAAQRDSDE